MEKKFRIQDDLYEYVNHEELSKREIPNDLPSVGGFRDLSIKVEKTLMNDFEGVSKCIHWLISTLAKKSKQTMS